LLEAVSSDLEPIAPSDYTALFRAFTEAQAVRPRFGRHPRLAILGAQEARLLDFDVVVLGGLNEGTWPNAAAPDPWLSRPMRTAIGLEAPERAIGLAAHDFAMLAAHPRAIITRSTKVDGAPTIPSRWLQRLRQLAAGLTQPLPGQPPRKDPLGASDEYLAIARAMAATGPAEREPRACAKPPLEARPRRLSISDAEVWRRDPYAVYAKRVLDLKPLDPLDAAVVIQGEDPQWVVQFFLQSNEPPVVITSAWVVRAHPLLQLLQTE